MSLNKYHLGVSDFYNNQSKHHDKIMMKVVDMEDLTKYFKCLLCRSIYKRPSIYFQ